MTGSDLIHRRLRSQAPAYSLFPSPKDVMAHLDIMQSQDAALSEWPRASPEKCPKAATDQIIDQGEVLLRTTWHLVPAPVKAGC